MKQKILAIFLSVVMLLGMLPASIIAGATDGETTDTTTESTLPAGTVGYFMDVPKTEQYLKSKYNGVKCFGWSAYLCMNDTPANAANPFSDNVTDYITGGDGGAYIRVMDDEEFIIINPAERYVADYTTSSKTETTTTTDENGNVTKVTENVVSTSTDIPSNAGKLNEFNGQIWFNGISSVENSAITSDVTGLPLIKDELESSITHLAFRIKIVGGHKDQLSILREPHNSTDYPTTAGLQKNYSEIYFIDAKTGTKTKNIVRDVIALPYGDFDGYMLVPVDYTILQTANQIFWFTYSANSSYYKQTSWIGRTLCMGDTYAVNDAEAFIDSCKLPEFTVKASAADLEITNETDTNKETLYSLDEQNWMSIDEINALTYTANTKYTIYARYPWTKAISTEVWTTPSSTHIDDSASYFMNVPDYATQLKKSDGYFGWSASLPMEASRDPFAATSTANSADGYQSGEHGVLNVVEDEYGETFLILNPREQLNSSGKISEVNMGINYTKFGNTEPEPKGLPEGVTLEDISHWAIRVKITGGVSGQKSTFSFYINDSYGFIWPKNATLIDYKTGEVREAGGWNGNGFVFTEEFDGWIIIPVVSISENPRNFFFNESTSFQIWTHTNSCTHGGNASGSTWDNNRILWFGDFVVLGDYDKFVNARLDCANIGRHYVEAVEAVAPSAGNIGSVAHYACANCKKTFADAEGKIPTDPTIPSFYGASLTLEQNISVNFKVDASWMERLTNVYAKFTFDGSEKIVKANAELDDNGRYVFTYDGIGPHNFGKTITAQLFGTYDGTEYESDVIDYSVKDYCYNKLAEYEKTEGKEEFRTLLVDLLYYGAKAQIYSNTDVANLVNAELGHVGNINRTVKATDISEGTGGIYDDLDDASTIANWKGVNLYFEDKVSLKFRFETTTTQGVTVKVSEDKEGLNVIKEISKFSAGENGTVVALFDGLDATEMRKTVYVAVYKDGVKVSDTLAYDIVSYARGIITSSYVSERVKYVNEVKKGTSWPGDPYKNLKVLVSYMLRYGDAAAAYAATKA